MAGRPRKHNAGELCETCGQNEKQFKGYSKAGSEVYRNVCQACHKGGNHYRPWQVHRGEECELCGYEPLWFRSLDVHHRDGDKENNDPDNLMTLCATCHRELEATIHDLGDWEKAESWLTKFLKRTLG